mmetsp:Transcript_24838/g.74101  ORF Transcript_24838/g.74101 Transcript_24838/m.74101 type:complete len:96 (-) Transcript_24838:498-785(-)
MGFSPHDSDPEGCDELMRSEAVLGSLMCHGDDPLLLSRLPAARLLAELLLGGTPNLCGVCTGMTPPPPAPPAECIAADAADPCGEDAGVTVGPES